MNSGADLLSRGAEVASDADEWFCGPEFLSAPEICLPQPLHEEPPDETVKSLVTAGASPNVLEPIFSHYSSWTKMKRAVAWWSRLKSRLKTGTAVTGPLSSDELQQAELYLIKSAQQCYGCDKNYLATIANLSPYRDDNAVLRVGGRIVHGGFEHSHPVIIPHDHPVAKAIILDAHTHTHCGPEWTLSLVLGKYWITKGRALVKSVLRKCVICKKLFAQPLTQKMADLPPGRLSTSRVFSDTGVDVMGPVYVKNYRHEVKRYVCVFTCMSVRAIHLEKINTLDTDSFVNALRRFTARRGPIIALYSEWYKLCGSRE